MRCISRHFLSLLMTAAFVVTLPAARATAQSQETMAGCMGGDAEACLEGTRMAQSEGDFSLMLTFVKQGCELGNTISCSDLGMAYLVGRGVPKDVDKAKPLIVSGCRDGYGRACANLGWMHYTGTGVAQNTRKAVMFYTQGCDGRSGAACANLALMYEIGDGVAQDFTKADQYFDRACDLGNVAAC
jgi:TPR repeat protein